MNDCLNAIEDREVNDLSDYELRALKEFLELGQAIVDNEDEIQRIIDKHYYDG
jgi:transcription termination factor NusB